MLPTIITLFHVLGVILAARSIYISRSPQGSIAWAMALVLLPYVAIPAYLVLGRNKFQNYVRARRAEDLIRTQLSTQARDEARALRSTLPDEAGDLQALDRLSRMPLTHGNHFDLLIDGQATFDAIFADIDKAERYILVQFYIVRDDGLGRALRDRLAARARAGIPVFFLYDEIGSHSLSKEYLRVAREAGIDIRSFHTTQGEANRFQLNFRNHRKIVVVDGRVAFVGGHNVGDEYLGLDSKIGPWRDTHVRIEGPMIIGAQLAFAEDWHWRAKVIPDVIDWTPRPAERGDFDGIIVPSGPADPMETCGMMFAHLMHTARKRIWIATPYFVPDEATMFALSLAVMRGLDVRVIVPANNDSLLVNLGSQTYLDDVARAGVQIFRYRDGFMHQKVMLVDDIGAAIGTANMDSRSYRLNFEITAITVDRSFAAEVEKMLLADLERSDPVDPAELSKKPWHYRLGVKFARLFAPIL